MLDYARVRLTCSSIYAVILGVQEIVENAARSDLIWDNEARGLCVRVYPDGSNSFIFLYRINGHQRFVRLGSSPGLSLKTARTMATQLRRIVDEGREPVIDERDRRWMTSFDKFVRHIAEHVSTLESRSIAAAKPSSPNTSSD
jgi:Arm DNA-binding domain